MDSGPVVRRTDADIVATTVSDAAGGKLAQTIARCQAALAAAEESVQRAQAALATAEERLRRAQDVQMRFRELQASSTRAA
jgi:multidrug resistance efflux pump